MRRKLDVVRRPASVDDLEAQAKYIAQSQPAAAIRLIDQFDLTVEYLRTMPRLGHKFRARSREFAGIRRINVLKFRSFSIFYRVHPDAIEVLRLLHGSRDLARILRDGV